MPSLDESYAYAERLTRAHARNFYYGFWFLPPERRRSIHAVYAFSRRADDAVDSAGEDAGALSRARESLDRLRALYGDEPPDDPLAPALRDTRKRFSIERQPFDDLLAGMEMDLVKKRYETFEELQLYCYRAASVVGLVCLQVFGYKSPAAREPAIQLGIAMQLTNILRDIAEDRDRGRIYLPREDMERFGYSCEDLLAGAADGRFRDLMRFEVERAREYFRRSEPLFPLLLPESRNCPILLMRFYGRILERIERQDYDVLSRRPSLPWHEKLILTGSTWLGGRGRITSRRKSRSSRGE